jgi:hypothetical protein
MTMPIDQNHLKSLESYNLRPYCPYTLGRTAVTVDHLDCSYRSENVDRDDPWLILPAVHPQTFKGGEASLTGKLRGPIRDAERDPCPAFTVPLTIVEETSGWHYNYRSIKWEARIRPIQHGRKDEKVRFYEHHPEDEIQGLDTLDGTETRVREEGVYSAPVYSRADEIAGMKVEIKTDHPDLYHFNEQEKREEIVDILED